MTRLESLTALKHAVEAGGDVYGFGVIGRPLLRGYAESAYNGSLDAARALRQAVLPGPVPAMMHSDARKELLDILSELIILEQA